MPTATYTLGTCTRPSIRHDNGFLDKFARRAPTVQDHLMKQWWVGKLEAAEAAQDVPFLPHNDISDALAAYRHFLEGGGRQRTFSYDRYVANDPSGRTALRSALFDVQIGAWELLMRHYLDKDTVSFEMTGSAIAVGSGSVFPYPATENWQKAIGGHVIWLCAKVSVQRQANGQTRFAMDLTLHAEDMYNFNPGAKDIATGIPDEANGVFELTGLGQQYLNVATLRRHVVWSGRPDASGVAAAKGGPWRDRQPSDNRRLRNRL